LGLVLVAAGAIFALLFILVAIINVFRAESRLTFWDTLLAFLVACLPLAGLMNSAMQGVPDSLTVSAVLILAVILGAISLLILVGERARKRLTAKTSRGVFGLGIGVLLAVSTFTVPLTAEQILLPALATATPIDVAALQRIDSETAVTGTAFPTFTPTSSPTATITRTPRPTETPSPTRMSFASRTPEPTATAVTPCLALALYNLNQRSEPDTNAELQQTIPFDNTVALYGRTADSVWWYGEYEGKQGWMMGEYMTLSASCERLPVVER